MNATHAPVALILPTDAPSLAAGDIGPYTGTADGQAYAVCGDVWCMVDEAPRSNPYFRNPRDVSATYWTSGRECEAPRTVNADTDSADALAQLAFPDVYLPGVCAANDGYAMAALAPLAADGWVIQPADPRGMNDGGADLHNPQTGEQFYLVADDASGQWVFHYWNEFDGVPESTDFAAAEYGDELDPELALRLAREFLSQPRLVAARAALMSAPGRYYIRDVCGARLYASRDYAANRFTLAPKASAYCYASRAEAWAALPHFAAALGVSSLLVVSE